MIEREVQNIWKTTYHEPWYRIDRKIKNFFRRWRWARQRVKRGYSDYDLWSFDNFLLGIFHDGLIDLAENHYSRPWRLSDEEWADTLKEIAESFKKAKHYLWDYKDKEAYGYMEQGMDWLKEYFFDLWD